MNIITSTTFKRLFMKESVNAKGERCLIGKVVDRSATPPVDLIVVCNPDTMKESGMNRTGRWDVGVKPMRSGRGFVVLSGEWCFDHISLQVEEFKISLLINGREEKLKVEGKYIPLYFDCRDYYNPTRVARSIRQKLSYMQLPENVDVDGFLDAFLQECVGIEKEYKKYMIKNVGKHEETRD